MNSGVWNNLKRQGIDMYCSSCGAQIVTEAVICPKCGCATPNFKKESGKVTDYDLVASYVLGALIPLVGIIMGIFLLAKGKSAHAIGVILVSIGMFLFWWIFCLAVLK
jgi:uncharacterized OB-fold protein